MKVTYYASRTGGGRRRFTRAHETLQDAEADAHRALAQGREAVEICQRTEWVVDRAWLEANVPARHAHEFEGLSAQFAQWHRRFSGALRAALRES
jgi:hypothetical protein